MIRVRPIRHPSPAIARRSERGFTTFRACSIVFFTAWFTVGIVAFDPGPLRDAWPGLPAVLLRPLISLLCAVPLTLISLGIIGLVTLIESPTLERMLPMVECSRRPGGIAGALAWLALYAAAGALLWLLSFLET